MAWRIVLQPNGKFARFSEVVDNFTIWNLSEDAMLDYIMAFCNVDTPTAISKIERAKLDLDINDKQGDGLYRWRQAIDIIGRVHGDTEAQMMIDTDKEIKHETQTTDREGSLL